MKAKLFLSIALATYNGERYIREQLDSIAHQTRLPDELVISDDASVDATLEIIRDFTRSVPFPVRLHINQNRLGSTHNFEKAIRTCRDGIIFLCDQDDVWYPDKIARIEECFVRDAKAGIVFTDANVVNNDLESCGPRLWKRLRFNPREQACISDDVLAVLLRHYVVTGATMAFRSNFRKFILPIPREWVHDAWIAQIIGFSSHFVALPIPLIAYRQHDANQVGLPRRGKNKGKNSHSIHFPRVLLYQQVRDRLLELADCIPNAESKIIRLNEKIAFLSVRAKLPVSRWHRLSIITREFYLLRYHRYAKKNVGTFLNDLLRKG